MLHNHRHLQSDWQSQGDEKMHSKQGQKDFTKSTFKPGPFVFRIAQGPCTPSTHGPWMSYRLFWALHWLFNLELWSSKLYRSLQILEPNWSKEFDIPWYVFTIWKQGTDWSLQDRAAPNLNGLWCSYCKRCFILIFSPLFSPTSNDIIGIRSLVPQLYYTPRNELRRV